MNEFGNDKCDVIASDAIGRYYRDSFEYDFLFYQKQLIIVGVRYVIATKPLKQGELLLCEEPVIIGLCWGSSLCCLACYKDFSKICK